MNFHSFDVGKHFLVFSEGANGPMKRKLVQKILFDIDNRSHLS
ncbi:hypothetical protein GMO_09840 [Gluconobacter morbifer G707]|uniref:Uncharacterized protein n=1 Tax=Gluconobacter morbifer G707 TaxID=1088869 RepID=G6XHL8_9PROT|nr:hypothetical protein GMO_09840 [Gluconobacter morbifer G707]